MKSSPWGKVQWEKKYGRGITAVSTAGHGGYLISKGVAKKRLSAAALKYAAEEWNGYYAFEEDCACAVLFLELPEIRKPEWNAEAEESIVRSISRWLPDYLLATGRTPAPEAYADYLAGQEDYRRRVAKDPDLIVAAVGQDDGRVKVHTADDKEHFVTSESYEKRSERRLNLLSECTPA